MPILQLASIDEKKIKKSGISRFRQGLRSSIRGLWSGVLTFSQAIDAFHSALEKGITEAWNEGAKECGIKPDELTQEELIARDDFIFEQIGQSLKLLDEVNKNSKKNGGKLTPFLTRLEMWVNQYGSAKMQAESMACANEKRIWVLGAAEKHCSTCPRLAGKVKRMSFWQAHVLPRNAPNPKLECGGFNCQCSLERTKLPISKGPLPRTP